MNTKNHCRLFISREYGDRLFKYCETHNLVDPDGRVMYRDIVEVALIRHLDELEKLEKASEQLVHLKHLKERMENGKA